MAVGRLAFFRNVADDSSELTFLVQTLLKEGLVVEEKS